ncbi:ABC transporter ATP-binding protein [Novosphingobium album (ex Hu et al. 2023)]|uniref:ABC transporter ATP-binding protein n=1 Tax=Novosphingobium album (ex Hu et al. 2023) TaxID=2930093 RepID=A0ABT0B7S9_9SPHN|nr:ABC transporter ATP-binding protein [Novosphingobium album (ex Hu et al. 2023)]MCJ2180918.1 ABC transporter ATP-binding protein [Novosphingobium album (ex Hu et al. 2023)]
MSPAAKAASVDVRGLSVHAVRADGSSKAIVEDISFSLPPGEVLALIGESGSGKTTIALAMMGFSRFGGTISAEEIRVGDMRIDQMDEHALTGVRGHRIAYIAQSAAAAFNPSRPIMAQVIEPLLVHGQCSRKAAEAKAITLFRALALPEPETIGSRYPHQVSGGQLQRLMAAMALISDPELVILDEPTTALDVTTQVEVLRTFKSVIAQSGATAIYVSHDLAVVAQVADRIVVLKDGRMCEDGRAGQILEAPANGYTRALLSAARPAARPASQTAAENVLTVSGIHAGYGRVTDGVPAIPVLTNIDFTLKRGATLGVIGESGSGKSTLARVIAGLLPAARGEVRLEGERIAPRMEDRSREQLRRIQLVFQNADTALNPAQTVGQILARPLAFYHGIKGAQAHARVAELLDMIRLPASIMDRRSNELSGGQKQRVNLARAFAAQPDVLLCDEVTSALDTVVGAAILDLIDELRRELGITTVFISHDITTVRAFCDQMLVLYAGTPVELSTRETFAGAVRHPYTRLLVDSVPEMDPEWLAQRAAAERPALAVSPSSGPRSQPLCRFLARCPVAVAGTCDVLPPPVQETAGQRLMCHHTTAQLAAPAPLSEPVAP